MELLPISSVNASLERHIAYNLQDKYNYSEFEREPLPIELRNRAHFTRHAELTTTATIVQLFQASVEFADQAVNRFFSQRGSLESGLSRTACGCCCRSIVPDAAAVVVTPVGYIMIWWC